MSQADAAPSSSPQSTDPAAGGIAAALRSFAPQLLFGLRLWASVCLALYVAFCLELDNPSWAGTSAAIVCQPRLGASLRKASFRMLGTLIGAMAIVFLTAAFPQNRLGFLLGLALWGAACGFWATVLRNFAAYGAALAGYTAAIIGSDELGATGGPSGQVILLAVSRATEICIGILSAGVVLAGTDFGRSRRSLAAKFADRAAEIAVSIAQELAFNGPVRPDTRGARRELIRGIIALDPIIDAAIGEDSEIRYRSRILQTAVNGFFAALSGWRLIGLHLQRAPVGQGSREAAALLDRLPPGLRAASAAELARSWRSDPSRAREACAASAKALLASPAGSRSVQLLIDSAAEAMLGLSRALNGLALLVEPGRVEAASGVARLRVPDWAPAWVSAARVFITIITVELFWVATAWPSGAQAMMFAAIVVILFAPQAEEAYTSAISFLIGSSLAAALAAIVKFAILPQIVTFEGFCLVIGLFLVPLGSLVAQQWRTAIFFAAAVNFTPLLAPTNRMSYDTGQFYNSAVAILAGIGAAALAIRLLPPLAPEIRTRRLLRLTLMDLRRLAECSDPPSREDWDSRVYGRLNALPEQAEPLRRAELAAALSVGGQIIRLRKVAPRFGASRELGAALAEFVAGRSASAVAHLAAFDVCLAAAPPTEPGAKAGLRARAGVLAMSEALAEYADYFDGEAGR
ncbi:FUSC family protein [Methylocapsa acidiphila]|uniref:FUSC family protein n=1 Tax=Methylocapsa acidiphila TaxID=133552 RepID=UPI0012ECB4DE|nr:FUSC family protein [Methylocapsa acidiphila]